jgi:beta-galactosidase beta subunit
MPNYLPFGKHKIDYGLIVADYQKIDLNTPGTNSWETCKSVAKIHYVVEGTEKIDLLTKSRFWRSEVNSTENSNSNKEQISAILEKGGFLVVFPGESFRSQVLCAGEISLKKVVISIPIQRVV